jgi:hypothetical protein
LKSLFPPRSLTDAEAMSAMGEDIVPFLCTPPKKAREAMAYVRALRLIGTARAKHCLRNYLGDGRISVVSELAQGVNACEIAMVREMLSREDALPQGIAFQVVDLSPLSGLTSLALLRLMSTKVTDLSPLFQLSSLRILTLGESTATGQEALREKGVSIR